MNISTNEELKIVKNVFGQYLWQSGAQLYSIVFHKAVLSLSDIKTL